MKPIAGRISSSNGAGRILGPPTLLVLAMLASWPFVVYSEHFSIADGDVNALRETFDAANADEGPDTISLAPGGTYILGQPRLTVETIIVLNGNGATVVGDGAITGFVMITEVGHLTVNDLNAQGFGFPQSSGSIGVFWNRGYLWLNRSALFSNTAYGSFLPSTGGAVDNSGTLRITNSTLSGNKTRNGVHFSRGGAIWNSGIATIENSTLTGNCAISVVVEEIESADGGAVYNVGQLTLVNSVLSGNCVEYADSFRINNCNEDAGIQSDGFNMEDADTCKLTGPGDQVGIDPLLMALADNGGLTLTHALEAASPAINAGRPPAVGGCIAVDQRGLFRKGRCDIGAYEINAKSALIEPPFTASWFYPPQDGHGFNIEILPGGVILVFWYAYDAEGFQRWFFGVGTIAGNRADIPLTTTEGMQFGVFDPATNQKLFWGTLVLFVKDCLTAYVEWYSSTDGFVSGGMPLERITVVEGLECDA